MKDFKIIYETIVFKDGKSYPYNLKHKNKKLDIYQYAQNVGLSIKEAIQDIEKYGGYTSPKSGVIFFRDYEKINEVVNILQK